MGRRTAGDAANMVDAKVASGFVCSIALLFICICTSQMIDFLRKSKIACQSRCNRRENEELLEIVRVVSSLEGFCRARYRLGNTCCGRVESARQREANATYARRNAPREETEDLRRFYGSSKKKRGEPLIENLKAR